jgi:hypothetical protein
MSVAMLFLRPRVKVKNREGVGQCDALDESQDYVLVARPGPAVLATLD